MSKAWFLILVAAISTLLFVNPDAAVTAFITGSHAAVALSIKLVALYAFWLGLFAIIEKIGLADKLARLLKPVIKFLFPGVSEKCEGYVTMNIAANILGLGNASTPMAIKAIGEMDDGQMTHASQNMIMLVVISCTSLQLLPTTVIGLRATHGSVHPTDFLLPATIATIVSTVLGIIMVKLIGKLRARVANKKNTAIKNVQPKTATAFYPLPSTKANVPSAKTTAAKTALPLASSASTITKKQKPKNKTKAAKA